MNLLCISFLILLGESWSNLRKQRIAIARALLRDPAVLELQSLKPCAEIQPHILSKQVEFEVGKSFNTMRN